MRIKNDLKEALGAAMKKKDEIGKRSIRMALSAIKLAEVEKKDALDDIKIINILLKEIKIKEETIAEAGKADREDMITPLREEIKVLKRFLPPEMGDEELTSLITRAISDHNASTLKQMGIVMKTVISQVQGRASNDRISKITKSKLAN